MKYVTLIAVLLLCSLGTKAFAKGGLMKLQSPEFKHGEKIPKKFTCQGSDASPALTFADVPEGTQSFVLIVDDPDAPNGTFDHWVAWNIPGSSKGLSENAKVPNQGKNGFGNDRYGGPCPPPGKPHRYFFKLFALDIKLDLPNGSSKKQIEGAMQGHILEKAELMGTFQR